VDLLTRKMHNKSHQVQLEQDLALMVPKTLSMELTQLDHTNVNQVSFSVIVLQLKADPCKQPPF